MSLLNYGFWGMFNIRVPCAREKHQTIKPYRENCQSRGDRLDFFYIFLHQKLMKHWSNCLSHTKPFQDPMIQQPVRHGRGAALAKVLRTPEVVKAFLEPPASCKGNPLGKCPIGGKNQHRNHKLGYSELRHWDLPGKNGGFKHQTDQTWWFQRQKLGLKHDFSEKWRFFTSTWWAFKHCKAGFHHETWDKCWWLLM